jgi:hypothetical protein
MSPTATINTFAIVGEGVAVLTIRFFTSITIATCCLRVRRGGGISCLTGGTRSFPRCQRGWPSQAVRAERLGGPRRELRGDLVRVGTPHLKEVANDRCVSLSHLVAAHLDGIEERRAAVERQLVAIRQETMRLEEIEKTLAEYDHRAYLEARKLLAAEERAGILAQRVLELKHTAEAARRSCADAEDAVGRAEIDWEETAAARHHMGEAARLERELASLETAVGRLHRRLVEADLRGTDRS